MATPRLNITEIDTTLGMKHLNANQGFRDLENICNSYFLDTLTTPPVSPNKGDIYLVGTAATGDFNGQDNNLALWDGFKWLFKAVIEGLKYYNVAADRYEAYLSTGWSDIHDLPYFLESTGTVNGVKCSTYGLNTTTVFNLPTGVIDGERITLIDYAGTFGGSNLSIQTTGGNTIVDGVKLSQIIDIAYAPLELIYANNVWRIIAGAGSGISILPDGVFPAESPGLNVNLLTADTNVYVDFGTGNDSNDGTIGSPFLTMDRAFVELSRFDLDIYDFIINVSGNTTFSFASPLNLRQYRTKTGVAKIKQLSGSITLQADVSGFTGCINILEGSHWELEDWTFSESLAANGAAVIKLINNSRLTLSGTYSFTGTGPSDFIEIDGGELILKDNVTFNLFQCRFFITAESGAFIYYGEPGNNLSATINTLAVLNNYIHLRDQAHADLYVTYSGSPFNSGISERYIARGNSILRRNNDPAGPTTDQTPQQGLII